MKEIKRALAFDFGASSGRAMLAKLQDGKIHMEEIHRFTNDPVMINGTLYWDVVRLMYEIKKGISIAVNSGGFHSIGIDTWGVDFGLIGVDGQLIGNPVHYRDSRTDNFMDFKVPWEEVYKRTGTQKMKYNTIFQLDSLVKKDLDYLKRVDKILFMPDLFNYFLTGVMKTEYTLASTSQLLNAKTRNWDYELIAQGNIPEHIFTEIVEPCTVCGVLSDEICEELSAPKASVVCVASHDTASAVVSVPTQKEDYIYISCGTWALMGTEISEPIINEKALKYNFTNEGGIGKIRFLKNIMGTWLIQESRRQWIREGIEYSFAELNEMAEKCDSFVSIINVDDDLFMKPGNLPRRIKEYCEKTHQYIPQTPGEIIRCINESLALKFRHTLSHIEACTEISYPTIHMLGGGVKSNMLCQMTADCTNRVLLAGPDEATVLGNVVIQFMANGAIDNLKEARKIIEKSSDMKKFIPTNVEGWEEAYERFKTIMEE